MKGDGRVAESCMFVGPGALGRAVELDSLDAGEEPVQHEPDFEPREVRSETEVAVSSMAPGTRLGSRRKAAQSSG